MPNKIDEYRKHRHALTSSWDGIMGDSDIPAWSDLSDLQREAMEGLGYGPLSYPHYVEEYKRWYSQPNATYNLYQFLDRQQDTHWGGHGSDYIEGEFERRREKELMQAAVDAAKEVVRDGQDCIHDLGSYGKSYEVGRKAVQALMDALAALQHTE